MPDYRLLWSDESARWSVAPEINREQGVRRAVVTVGPGATFDFEIFAPSSSLEGVELRLASAPSRAKVRTSLRDEAGVILAQKDTTIVGRPALHRVLDLGEVSLTPGKRYTVSVQSSSMLSIAAATGSIVRKGRYELRRQLERLESRRLFLPTRTSGAVDSILMVVGRNSLGAVETAAAASAFGAAFPGWPIQIVDGSDLASTWASLACAGMVVFVDIWEDGCNSAPFGKVCFELHKRGVATIFLDTGSLAESTPDLSYVGDLRGIESRRRMRRRRCHYSLIAGSPPKLIENLSQRVLSEKESTPSTLMAAVKSRRLPKVAVVCALYAKAEVIEAYLEHMMAQSYQGEIEVVLVNDLSPQNDALKARLFAQQITASNRRVVVIDNESNSGNCQSRLNGIAATDAEIIVVMDCDCLVNKDFIAAHVFEHWFEDVDVVIGPLNIESNDQSAAKIVAALESDPSQIKKIAEPQDSIQDDGFLNCITRNFSIKRSSLGEEALFDLDFSYSAKPDSGFGWEDVEMGYRLYRKGAFIRFTDLAFSVHCSHDSSASEAKKVRGSARNFLRLFEKHPDLALVARRWSIDTYDKITTWGDSIGLEKDSVHHRLDGLFQQDLKTFDPLVKALRGSQRRLKVLTYRWHVPHQYELYKLPHDFTLVTGLGNPMADTWSYDQRPLRPNVNFMHESQVDPRDFDVAILHFDENVLAPHLSNGVIHSSWGDPFRWALELRDIPKVAICHGTPQFEGQYNLDTERKKSFQIYEEERARLVSVLAKSRVAVVCNSHQALKEWRFENSRVIWHGFDPQEFPAGRRDLGVLALAPDMHRPHYRGAWEQLAIESKLDSTIRIQTASHAGAAIEPLHGNAFATRHFRSYVDRIGRFKAYLNTTLRSPMPRSRGEAMMTGVIPVCLRNHDVDLFIDHGVDGFYSDSPEELADQLNFLFRNPDIDTRMGVAARRKAMDVFNHDRYLNAWVKLLRELTD